MIRWLSRILGACNLAGMSFASGKTEINGGLSESPKMSTSDRRRQGAHVVGKHDT
jgi:hypothetical protein